MDKLVQKKKDLTKQYQNQGVNSKIDTGNAILIICGLAFAFFPNILFYGIGIVLGLIFDNSAQRIPLLAFNRIPAVALKTVPA